MKRFLFYFFILIIIPYIVNAQKKLSLNDCLEIAHKNSTQLKQAKNILQETECDYNLFKKNNLPSISLSGTIPSFNHAISKITMPNGSEAFISQSIGSYLGKLSIIQPLTFLGSSISISSSLQRLDLYGESKNTSFLATPITIGFNQPIFSYNSYKWEKKKQPLLYQEAQQKYIEERENINVTVLGIFKDCIQMQKTLEIKQNNIVNTDTLLELMRQKYQLGKCTEDELLELEAKQLNLELERQETQNSLNDDLLGLFDILKIDLDSIKLEFPNELNIKFISKKDAYEKAIENNSIETTHKIKILEAQSSLEQIKKDNGASVQIYTNIGVSQSDKTIPLAYKNLLNQEVISLTLNVPIVDFGKKKYKIKKSELELNNVEMNIQLEEEDFIKELYKMVDLFNTYTLQLSSVKKSVELNYKRFQITKERFVNGKISFLEYSNAQEDKNNSLLSYYKIVLNQWLIYYQIRQKTLFDYQTGQKITK